MSFLKIISPPRAALIVTEVDEVEEDPRDVMKAPPACRFIEPEDASQYANRVSLNGVDQKKIN